MTAESFAHSVYYAPRGKNRLTVLGDHIAAVESIDLGGNGGTHRLWFNGKDINDLILLEREIQKTKAFQTFIEERGEVEIVKSYLSERIHRFN